MSGINKFLQKRKLHNRQHRYGMVIISYALSVCMLLFGSDVFYDIRPAAVKSEEDTGLKPGICEKQYNITEGENLRCTVLQNSMLEHGTQKSKLINPYGLWDKEPPHIKNCVVNFQNNNSSREKTVAAFAKKAEVKKQNEADKESEQTKKGTKEKQQSKDDKGLKTQKKKKRSIESLSIKVNESPLAIDVSGEEQNMLRRIVEAEASGEDVKGKILIANVVFNRMADEDFPDTVEKVVFQKTGDAYQFSPISDKRYWSVKISKETKEAVSRALKGEDYSNGALYFMARGKTTGNGAAWFDRSLDWLFKHGRHEFYKNK
jgi:N-acetylmuramoyl-L-alanine amidase